MNTILAQRLTLPGETPVVIQGKLDKLNNVGDVISSAIPYVFVFAGLGLLFMIVGAGFSMLTSAGDAKKMEAGKNRLTYAIIGFLVIFVAYWGVQIAGLIFGLSDIQTIFK